MSKDIKIGYRILKIHTTSFSIQDVTEDQFKYLFENGNSLLNIGSNINFDMDKSNLIIDIKSSLNKKGENKQIISHTGRTIYFIQDMDKYYKAEDDSYTLPDNFILQLLGIAFSHSRALLTTELQSTVYADKFILPVINPSVLLPKTKDGSKKN